MEKDDFYPFMKVCLNGEYGVVTDQFWESDGVYTVNGKTYQGVASKLYGVIRWDSSKKSDFEDWRGLWGTFRDSGGQQISQDYSFQFIDDDGSLKAK